MFPAVQDLSNPEGFLPEFPLQGPALVSEQIKNLPDVRAVLQAILDQALKFHRYGRYRDAAMLYGQILRVDPQHTDSLHLLGMVASQAHMPEMAMDLIGRAIAINDQVAAYHTNLGTILQAENRLAEAELCYRRALRLDANMPEIHQNLGLVLQTQGRSEEAIACYERAILLNPGQPEAHSNLGNTLQTLGRMPEAIEHYRKALELKPEFPEASYNLGNALQAEEHWDEAAEAYLQAIDLRPEFAEAHANLGNVLVALERTEEAQEHYESALLMRPGYAEAHYNLANLHSNAGRLDEAIEQYQIALRFAPQMGKAHNNLGNVYRSLDRAEEAVEEYAQVPDNDPEFTDAYNNMGLALMSLGRHAEAEASIRRTLQLKPHLAQAWCNLGAVLHAQNRIVEARECYQKALERKADLSKARLNLGLIELVEGDLEDGWKSYETRWEYAPLHRRNFSQPLWQGEPLNGRRILIHSEQGHGDTLQFSRYLPMVKAAGGRVFFEVQQRLVRMAAELSGVDAVCANGEPLPEFDLHCPLLSLPLIFGTTLQTIPAPPVYMQVPEVARQKAGRIAWPESGLKIGVLWSGNPSFAKDPYRNRAFPLTALEPLLDLQDAVFFSLQIGEPSLQLRENPALADRILDLEPYVGDMADTAAQIEHLDLIIASDTSVPHLAAALGKPTWVLLPYSPDWRWLQQRSDTPWYPTMRLFRQTAPGDWTSAVERVRAELRIFADQTTKSIQG